MPWIEKIYYNLKIEKQRKAYVKKQTEIWRKNNPGARKKHDDKYSVTHVEEKKIGDAIYYEKNIKKFSVWAAKYYQDHKDEILKRIKEKE